MNMEREVEPRIQQLADATIAQLQQRLEPGLFPLPLTPLEKYLWWDDSPQHPLGSFIEVEFDGKFNHDLMQGSLEIVVHLHPLLSCCISQVGKEWCWVYNHDHRPRLLGSESLAATDEGVQFIDLTERHGLLAWHSSTELGDRLLFQLHHACCDGNGFRRCVLDLLYIYVKLREILLYTTPGTVCKEVETMVGEIARRWQPALLRERFDFSAALRGEPKKPLGLWQKIKNAYYFHLQLPTPLSTSSRNESLAVELTDGEHQAFLKYRIEKELTQQVVQRCQEANARVNELALAILFRTCARWHQETIGSKGKRRIRLLMPYALMSRVDLRMPATNRLSFSFLGRLESDCQNSRQLLRSIQEEIQAIREAHLPMDFLMGLQAASRLPTLMRWAIGRSQRMCTAVLSYAGEVERGRTRVPVDVDGRIDLQDCKLARVYGAPPVRINTNFSLGLCISDGELCIGLAWSRSAMTREDATRFLQMYVDGWSDFETFVEER